MSNFCGLFPQRFLNCHVGQAFAKNFNFQPVVAVVVVIVSAVCWLDLTFGFSLSPAESLVLAWSVCPCLMLLIIALLLPR